MHVVERKKVESPDRVADLGDRMGISQRLVAYREAHGDSPSPELLVRFAEVVSTSELLGVPSRASERPNPDSVRLWRRFRRVQELPEGDRKTIFRMIDTFVEGSRRKRGS